MKVLWRTLVLYAGTWTLTLAVLVLWEFRSHHAALEGLMYIKAEMLHDNAWALQHWVGGRGGVYVEVPADYQSSPLLAMQPDPRPQVLISELGDSTVQLSFLAWIDQRETDLLKARSEAIRLVKAAFDAAGIEMPEPIYRIHLREAASLKSGEGGAARPEPAPTPRQAAAMAENSDVSADHAIDEQVAEDLRTSDEENLLKDG